MNQSNYRSLPCVDIKNAERDRWVGWDSIADQLNRVIVRYRDARIVVTVECYPGVFENELREALQQRLHPTAVFHAREAYWPPDQIDRLVAPDLTDDPVFGKITQLTIDDLFDPRKKEDITRCILSIEKGLILIYGTGAVRLAEPTILVYADLARWEAQLRFRHNKSSNLGVDNRRLKDSLQYKRAFFIDWRIADRLKQTLFDRWNFVLDTNRPDAPKMASGDLIRRALWETAQRPFSVVPYFDPAPWGGQWMNRVFGLQRPEANLGWCFNCVPEENSLLLQLGNISFELPSINVVLYQPLALLGPEVYERFGAEFPIRFDYLDTIEGGNLSFQVHPTVQYIRERFRMTYTQDESYYLIDAGDDASVYLGLKEGIDPEEMMQALEAAQDGGPPFNVEQFVNRWPAKKHDHFLIPAGTVHCSGKNAMVLEISATPYIFTFKLWDWGRNGLDGRPRPTHIDRGRDCIQWNRTSAWVKENLINRFEYLQEGEGWREERTGLHELEFIETRRYWFTGLVPHHTRGGVHVICLIEGDRVLVESPAGAFDPIEVRFGEVLIVPAAVGAYTIRPIDSTASREYATIKAFVRSGQSV